MSTMSSLDKSALLTEHPMGYYHQSAGSYINLNQSKAMAGVRRVITFCLLTFIVPAIFVILPLYLRHIVYAPRNLALAESDIVEVKQGINSIFCQEHQLRMNSSFNAFQLSEAPEFSERKHIRLKKSMTLPDDTLEYWGFFLLRGATVDLRVCSRHEGSRILVVKGERNLRTCGLLDHNKNKVGAHFAKDQGEVIVTFDTAAEVIESGTVRNTTKNEEEAKNTEIDHNSGGEVIDDSDVTVVRKRKHPKELHTNDLGSQSHNIEDLSIPIETSTHRIRHEKSKHLHQSWTHSPVNKEPTLDGDKSHINARKRRDLVFDAKINHGGNAINYTDKPSDSVSSFENSLLTCYDGQILLAQYFPPSNDCYNTSSIANRIGLMLTKHEVVSDGFYYYIFYSDNDLFRNDIHAIFDIYQPTYEYANISKSKSCINSTECSFPIEMFTDDKVIVEVPTRDGIENEDDDITEMLSICVPRSSVYLIFPILVLVFVLSCAFL
uniref:CSON007457 protein n=1 Tax=Culicoides sonorensis TaxID=179676 RepID=A0A336M1Q3_CULSO